jgi:hypothetical protein
VRITESQKPAPPSEPEQRLSMQEKRRRKCLKPIDCEVWAFFQQPGMRLSLAVARERHKEPETKQLLYFAGEPDLNPTGMPSGEDSREFQR